MNPIDPTPEADRFAELLGEFDDELARGRTPLLGETNADPKLGERLRLAQDCLLALEQLWPRGGSLSGANADATAIRSPQHLFADRIGRFRLVRELGRGGFGIVYLAYDPVLRREVALKVPRPEALLTPELRQRFLQEARAAAGLDHPGIVAVFEAGEEGGVCYIASAFCAGSNLGEWLRDQAGPTDPRLVAAVVAWLAEAVAFTHERGVLHRDLKPANVLLVPAADAGGTRVEGLPFVPKLTDFGLAKMLESSLAESRSSLILGTPLYMAPEQADPRLGEVGPSTDVYGLGVILYELLTGRTPFEGASLFAVLDRVRGGEEATDLRRLRPDVPADLAVICHKALQREPTHRYTGAAHLAADLRAWLRGTPISGRLPGLSARLNAWSLRPERIRDAGLVAIFVNAVAGIAWCMLSVFADLALRFSPPGSDPLLLVFQLMVPVLVFYLPQIWLGLKTLAFTPWAIWSGFVVSLAQFTVMVLILTLAGMEVWGYHRDFFERWNVFSLLITLVFVQLLAYLLAVRAYHWNRRKGYFSFEEKKPFS